MGESYYFCAKGKYRKNIYNEIIKEVEANPGISTEMLIGKISIKMGLTEDEAEKFINAVVHSGKMSIKEKE